MTSWSRKFRVGMVTQNPLNFCGRLGGWVEEPSNLEIWKYFGVNWYPMIYLLMLSLSHWPLRLSPTTPSKHVWHTILGPCLCLYLRNPWQSLLPILLEFRDVQDSLPYTTYDVVIYSNWFVCAMYTYKTLHIQGLWLVSNSLESQVYIESKHLNLLLTRVCGSECFPTLIHVYEIDSSNLDLRTFTSQFFFLFT